MFIKVTTDLFLKVKDNNQGEDACSSLESGLPRLIQQSGFPDGEVITVQVDSFREATDDEIKEHELDLE